MLSATLGFEHDVVLSGYIARVLFRRCSGCGHSPLYCCDPFKGPKEQMKAAKDESLAAAEVQSAFTVSSALLTAQMIKHLVNQIQAKNKIFLLYLVLGVELY